MLEKIVIFGAGGHAKVVIDTIEVAGHYEIAFLADADMAKVGTTLLGYPVRSEQEGFDARKEGVTHAFVAIGNNAIRKSIAIAVTGYGFSLATIAHPAAVISSNAMLGVGTLVMPGSIINADVCIGSNVIINTGAIIEHDCLVGDDVHISPRATLCGGVQVGDLSLVGAGATILPGVRIGTGTIVGASALVLSDVPDRSKAIGIPSSISRL
jgi:sugar O-acyltransferase (sialic acid O-acetyltransferase NeuD family)